MSQSKGSSVYRQGKDGPFPEVSYARMYSYGNGVQPGYLARFRSRVPNIAQRRLIEARRREESGTADSLSMPTARKSPWVLTGEAYLGKGSFGRVYKAIRSDTDQIVAVKKTRASRTLTHTQLNHERLILQRIQHHVSIPRVFAYGRAEQFEYLAIELLGPSLGAIIERCGPLPHVNVLIIAEQMISALAHIHNHNLVHVDVKPHNILTDQTNPSRLVLVDYGISRSISPDVHPTVVKPKTICCVVPGTLHYASIHLHHGSRPAPPDDIESLGYTLVNLSMGTLPWSYSASHGTRKIRQDQVLLTKQQCSGFTLAPNELPCVGDIIDYARNAKRNKSLDYAWLCSGVLSTRQRTKLDAAFPITWDIQPNPLPKNLLSCPKIDATSFPLTSGQIVCCQVDLRSSLEGFSARVGNLDFWHHPDLTRKRWGTKIRPAVILSVKQDTKRGLWMIQVACIGQGDPSLLGNAVSFVPITSLPTDGSITPDPTWRVPNSYCYVFMYPTVFYCYPGEVDVIPSRWTLRETDVRFLSLKSNQKLQSEEFFRHHYFYEVFARVTAFGDDLLRTNADGDVIDWEGGEAWHHDLQRVDRTCREYELCGKEYKPPRDTYYGSDYEQWACPQHELSASIAIDVDNAPSAADFPPLPTIVDLKLSDELIYPDP